MVRNTKKTKVFLGKRTMLKREKILSSVIIVEIVLSIDFIFVYKKILPLHN